MKLGEYTDNKLKERVNGISDEDFQSDHLRRFQDVVNNPQHYTVGGYEALDVIKAKLTPEEYRGYCKGNILKYIMRSNYKGHHDTDCDKANYYAKELADALENKEVKEVHWKEPIHPDTWTAQEEVCASTPDRGNEKPVREELSDKPF